MPYYLVHVKLILFYYEFFYLKIFMVFCYKHPEHDYSESFGKITWIWVLLFGPIFWAVKGVWTHFAAHLLLAIITIGIAHLIYPFFTYKILHNHYRKLGWKIKDES